MQRRVELLLVIALASAACGGQSIGSSSDASLDVDAASTDAGPDATFGQCPITQPAEGSDCYGANAGGLSCAYGSTVCTCENSVQNSVQWACTFGDDAGEADVDAGLLDCVYDDGGAQIDPSSRFHGSCAAGCPPGTVCVVEIGGVAGGGGEYCAPILDRCRGDVTCACLASCVCGSSFGRAERCTDTQQGPGTTLDCDNGVR